MKLQYSLAAAGLLLFSSVSLLADYTQDQAKSRVSPVNTVMDVNGSVRCLGFRSGETYNITWTTLGYDNNYTVRMVIFDCDPAWVADGTCGASYGTSQVVGNILYQADLTPTNVSGANWYYRDENNVPVEASNFDYSVTFQMPLYRASYFGTNVPFPTTGEGASTVIFRWYQVADGQPAGVPFISLLLGTEAGYHFGNNARRIQSTVASDVDSGYVCPAQ